jgi:TorA maturation chaperone TorD
LEGTSLRDPGLEKAIRSIGGVSELARRIGIAQPSVSNWSRIPAERVAEVEAATGVSRTVLRPDLFAMDLRVSDKIDEVDAARAHEYALLSALLVKAPGAELLERVAQLSGDDSPLGEAHRELAIAAARAKTDRIEREYFDVFIGVGRGELLPYASYYLTGFLHERPLARLRGDLFLLGIERAEDNPDPEDHIAFLCEIMAGIIGQRFGAEAGADRVFFEKHVKPWASRLFTDLENAETAEFYRAVGKVGRIFIEIETEAFALPS